VPPAVARAEATPPSFVGVITAADVVDVASRFDGVVAAVHVRAGDKVAAGQILVELDPRPMREQLSAAMAALAAAKAARRQADIDVEDAKRRVGVETKAVNEGVSPRVTLEEAQFAVKRAEAAAQRAASTAAAEGSRVQTARDHLADMSLRAKSDGVVAMRFKDPGATVTAGAPIVRVVGQQEPRLRFAVPPDEARAVTVGAEVTATIETIAAPVTAIVRQVSPTLDPASGMIIVEAELAPGSPTTELRPGLPATVALPRPAP
jgi:RND family efflux transporter MFP subunit